MATMAVRDFKDFKDFKVFNANFAIVFFITYVIAVKFEKEYLPTNVICSGMVTFVIAAFEATLKFRLIL
ncbi:hypothetical protein FACS189415_6850 [Bacteroidia bacterium]|nr:hypothetical protein FACS189415_6850 [Bacteroidia bacterium]